MELSPQNPTPVLSSKIEREGGTCGRHVLHGMGSLLPKSPSPSPSPSPRKLESSSAGEGGMACLSGYRSSPKASSQAQNMVGRQARAGEGGRNKHAVCLH